ncbi:unnamed protein product [Darwinula stevensoni]|uniref:Saccharopine dehydrogenase NADP binding domain-containing protein n=1 Tax=Darwinula stevensoni TaxID=69355 RepID=A0A7R8X6N5_9CRUS|nr:unnamed protein product [Darwinula stevensoni]CAG0886071.1 unnamed protein product [Darwinula stevensoni]
MAASGETTGDRYDVVIFGATGFTGKYVVRDLIQTRKQFSEFKDLTFAVAGRNKEKLCEALNWAISSAKATDVDAGKVPIITADVSDQESLLSMCKKSKVLVDCVGPYRFYGEPVIKACIEGGSSYVDISGETYFLEKMQLDYHEQAEAKGVYIVGACGFDSIPGDMGTIFLQDNFEGELNSVETYLKTEQGPAGYRVNYGTWLSAIHSLANTGDLRGVRTKLYPKPLPKPKFRIEDRGKMHQNPDVPGYSLPFLGSDRPVILRSQRFLYEHENRRPVQIQCYFTLASLLNTIGIVLFGAIFMFMTKFSFTRKLLEDHPSFFSFGMFCRGGPTEEQIEGAKFTVTLIGKGWSEKTSEASDQHADPPSKEMIVKVSGPDIGYVATSMCFIQSALTIWMESAKMPSKGGVYSPGAAFAKTSLIDRLNKRGIKFSIVKKD